MGGVAQWYDWFTRILDWYSWEGGGLVNRHHYEMLHMCIV